MILKTEFKNNIPRYYCSNCSKCTSHISINFTNLKHRGCCYYFPKFNLVDIQKMVQLPGGKNVLDKIINTDGTIIYKYHIETHGIFEEEKYQKFLQGNLELSNEELNILISDEFHDKSLFFKSCPFVEDGVGCTIPFQFRNPVCNFFLCHEIKNNAHDDKLIKEYENEAESFWKFYDWENMNLTHLLHENNLNLLKDFHKTLKFLANYEISYYDFPPLAEMDLHTEKSSTNFIK